MFKSSISTFGLSTPRKDLAPLATESQQDVDLENFPDELHSSI